MRIRGLPTMYCPCVDCLNQKKFAQWDNIFDHLITRGFKNKYTCWNRHGEEGLNEGEAECLNEGESLRHARGLNEGAARRHDDKALNEGEECVNFWEEECRNFGEDEAFPPEDLTEQEISGFNDDVQAFVDNIDEMVRDVEFQGVYTSSELASLKQLIEDSKKSLYPSCAK